MNEWFCGNQLAIFFFSFRLLAEKEEDTCLGG